MTSYTFRGKTRAWNPRDEEENRIIFSAMAQQTGITMPKEFKPIYPDDDEYLDDEWSMEQLIKLIRLYGFHRCLWDQKDPFNKNRKMRHAAMIDICTALGDDVTIKQVVSKINIFRNKYRHEKRRIKRRIKKGIGARTKLKWFPIADAFLRKVQRAEKFQKAFPSADSDSDLEDTVVFDIDPEMLGPLDQNNSEKENGTKPPVKDCNITEIDKQMDTVRQMMQESREKSESRTKSKDSIKFLKLYRKHKMLWNGNHKTYRERDDVEFKKGIQSMVRAIGGKVKGIQILRKINQLRCAYRVERWKLAQARAKGKKATSKIRWYPVADSFLRPFCMRLDDEADQDMYDNEPPITEYKDDEDDEFVNNLEVEDKPPSDNDHFNDTQSYHSDDDCPNHEPLTVLKTESSDDDKNQPPMKTPKTRRKSINRPWMQAQSIEFVDLLRVHGCLWDKAHPNYKKLQDRTKAVEDIAHRMGMPEGRIRKKIKILLKTYEAERKKIEKDVAYKTELIWYHRANEFLGVKDEMPPPVSFVDPDLMSPASPTVQSVDEDMNIKLEAPDSPRDFSDDHFGDAVDIPSKPPKDSLPPSPRPNSPQPPILPRTLSPPAPSITQLNNKPVHQADALLPIKVEPKEYYHMIGSDEPPIELDGPNCNLLENRWSLKYSVKFLRLYGAHRCLWDLNDPDYKDKDLRTAAMEDIAAAMGHGLDLEYVSKKIVILRKTYMQQRQRMLRAIKMGKEPEIHLRWFPLADSFLRPHIGLKAIKPGEKEIPQFDFQYVYSSLNVIDPELLNDLEGKGTQNSIRLGGRSCGPKTGLNLAEPSSSEDDEDDDYDDGFFK